MIIEGHKGAIYRATEICPECFINRINQAKRIVALFNRLVEDESSLIQSMQRPTHLIEMLGIDRYEARFLRGLTKVLLDWEKRK